MREELRSVEYLAKSLMQLASNQDLEIAELREEVIRNKVNYDTDSIRIKKLEDLVTALLTQFNNTQVQI